MLQCRGFIKVIDNEGCARLGPRNIVGKAMYNEQKADSSLTFKHLELTNDDIAWINSKLKRCCV